MQLAVRHSMHKDPQTLYNLSKTIINTSEKASELLKQITKLKNLKILKKRSPPGWLAACLASPD